MLFRSEEAALRSAGLEAKLAELSHGASDAVALDRSRIEELRAGLAETSRKLADELARRNGEVSTALDGLRQRLGSVETLRGDLDGLIGRLGGLENSSKEAKTDRDRVAQSLEVTRTATENRVGTVEQKLAGLEAAADRAQKAQADAVLVMALADLKSAIDAGRPFRPELDVVKRAAPAGSIALGPVEKIGRAHV